jgi:hypothetical protein
MEFYRDIFKVILARDNKLPNLTRFECPRIPDLFPDVVRLRPAASISNSGGVPPRVKTQHANGEGGTWRRFLPVPPPEPAGMERMKKMAHKGGRLDV